MAEGMTDAELDEIEGRLERARAMIHALCQPRG